MLNGINHKQNERNQGFTLVEVMTASAIFLIFSISMLTLFIRAVRVFRSGEEKISAISDARVALDRISRDMKRAKFALYPDETVLTMQGSPILVFSSIESRQTESGITNIVAYKHDPNNDTINIILYSPDFDMDHPELAEIYQQRVVSRDIERLYFKQDNPVQPQVITIRLTTIPKNDDQLFLLTRIFLRH